MANRFTIVERRQATMWMYAAPIQYDLYWDIKRNSDGLVIKSFTDYLESLKYHEALEDRSWLAS
jgi:hypothetical protein